MAEEKKTGDVGAVAGTAGLSPVALGAARAVTVPRSMSELVAQFRVMRDLKKQDGDYSERDRLKEAQEMSSGQYVENIEADMKLLGVHRLEQRLQKEVVQSSSASLRGMYYYLYKETLVIVESEAHASELEGAGAKELPWCFYHKTVASVLSEVEGEVRRQGGVNAASGGSGGTTVKIPADLKKVRWPSDDTAIEWFQQEFVKGGETFDPIMKWLPDGVHSSLGRGMQQKLHEWCLCYLAVCDDAFTDTGKAKLLSHGKEIKADGVTAQKAALDLATSRTAAATAAGATTAAAAAGATTAAGAGVST